MCANHLGSSFREVVVYHSKHCGKFKADFFGVCASTHTRVHYYIRRCFSIHDSVLHHARFPEGQRGLASGAITGVRTLASTSGLSISELDRKNASKVKIHKVGRLHKDGRGCTNTNDFGWNCHSRFIAGRPLLDMGGMVGLLPGDGAARTDCRQRKGYLHDLPAYIRVC